MTASGFTNQPFARAGERYDEGFTYIGAVISVEPPQCTMEEEVRGSQRGGGEGRAAPGCVYHYTTNYNYYYNQVHEVPSPPHTSPDASGSLPTSDTYLVVATVGLLLASLLLNLGLLGCVYALLRRDRRRKELVQGAKRREHLMDRKLKMTQQLLFETNDLLNTPGQRYEREEGGGGNSFHSSPHANGAAGGSAARTQVRNSVILTRNVEQHSLKNPHITRAGSGAARGSASDDFHMFLQEQEGPPLGGTQRKRESPPHSTAAAAAGFLAVGQAVPGGPGGPGAICEMDSFSSCDRDTGVGESIHSSPSGSMYEGEGVAVVVGTGRHVCEGEDCLHSARSSGRARRGCHVGDQSDEEFARRAANEGGEEEDGGFLEKIPEEACAGAGSEDANGRSHMSLLDESEMEFSRRYADGYGSRPNLLRTRSMPGTAARRHSVQGEREGQGNANGYANAGRRVLGVQAGGGRTLGRRYTMDGAGQARKKLNPPPWLWG